MVAGGEIVFQKTARETNYEAVFLQQLKVQKKQQEKETVCNYNRKMPRYLGIDYLADVRYIFSFFFF